MRGSITPGLELCPFGQVLAQQHEAALEPAQHDGTELRRHDSPIPAPLQAAQIPMPSGRPVATTVLGAGENLMVGSVDVAEIPSLPRLDPLLAARAVEEPALDHGPNPSSESLVFSRIGAVLLAV